MTDPKTLPEIVTEWLEATGFDGLTNGGCSCRVGDLMPCNQPWKDCVAGYLVKDDGTGCGWHIQTKNPDCEGAATDCGGKVVDG